VLLVLSIISNAGWHEFVPCVVIAVLEHSCINFIRNVRAERILFGSDIPFSTMATELKKILSLPISDREREAILGGNIRRLTGLAPLSAGDHLESALS